MILERPWRICSPSTVRYPTFSSLLMIAPLIKGPRTGLADKHVRAVLPPHDTFRSFASGRRGTTGD
jgi:hypothetical protein